MNYTLSCYKYVHQTSDKLILFDVYSVITMLKSFKMTGGVNVLNYHRIHLVLLIRFLNVSVQCCVTQPNRRKPTYNNATHCTGIVLFSHYIQRSVWQSQRLFCFLQPARSCYCLTGSQERETARVFGTEETDTVWPEASCAGQEPGLTMALVTHALRTDTAGSLPSLCRGEPTS